MMARLRVYCGPRPLVDVASICLPTDYGATGKSPAAPRPERESKRVAHAGNKGAAPTRAHQNVPCVGRVANNERAASLREGSTTRVNHGSHHNTRVPRRWVTRSGDVSSRPHRCNPCRCDTGEVQGVRSGEGKVEGAGEGGGAQAGAVGEGRRMRWSRHPQSHDVACGRCVRARKGTLHVAQRQEVRRWGC